jgi:hypothetical protein
MSTHVPTIAAHANIRWCRCGLADRHPEADPQVETNRGWSPASVYGLPGLTLQRTVEPNGGQ